MVHIVVEGSSDEGAARRIVEYAGLVVTDITSARGKSKLDPKIPKYFRAARTEAWVVFRDTDGECPVTLRSRLLDGLPENPLFSLRLAHTMTEAWLMADREGFARYFGTRITSVPLAPDEELHAKRTLLRLCLKSRIRVIREEVARDENQPAALYVHHLNSFALNHWDVGAAIHVSPSLRRAVTALQALPPSLTAT